MRMKLLSVLLTLTMNFGLTACGGSPDDSSMPTTEGEANAPTGSTETTTPDTEPEKNKKTAETKLKITVGEHVLTATLIDNATTRSLISKCPVTVPMIDLYSREMCYHFPDELPTDKVETTGYEVGEIIYWPPRHSFVILYAQNGERFSMQKIGRIDSGVGIFKQTGDTDVKLELLDK